MKQEETVLDILTLHRQGLKQRAIARRLGISRNTVKKYLENPGNAIHCMAKPRESLLDDYRGNISAWLEEDSQYRATWIYDRLCSMGFGGSYQIVKRHVHQIRETKQQVAFMRFETEPGNQAQVDFGEFQIQCPDGTVQKLYLFSMILGYSRKIYGEFIQRCDLPTFLDCHIRAFSYFGGVPRQILYDRMKNVYIGKLAGRDRFNPTLLGFALHYGFKPEVAPAYAAWVKGKIERPYAFIREGFWRGYGFSFLETANRDLARWLAIKDERIHGTTHQRVTDRFEGEKPLLAALPPQCFDTSYRLYRKVYKDCTLRFESNSYVVPHRLVGKKLVVRVKEHQLRIFDDQHLVVTYAVPQGKGHLVQDERFYEALKKDREMNRRKYHCPVRSKGRAKLTISPEKPRYQMDVEIRPVHLYDVLAKEVPLWQTS